MWAGMNKVQKANVFSLKKIVNLAVLFLCYVK